MRPIGMFAKMKGDGLKAKKDEQTDDLQGFPTLSDEVARSVPQPIPPCRSHGLLDDYDDVERVYRDTEY